MIYAHDGRGTIGASGPVELAADQVRAYARRHGMIVTVIVNGKVVR